MREDRRGRDTDRPTHEITNKQTNKQTGRINTRNPICMSGQTHEQTGGQVNTGHVAIKDLPKQTCHEEPTTATYNVLARTTKPATPADNFYYTTTSSPFGFMLLQRGGEKRVSRQPIIMNLQEALLYIKKRKKLQSFYFNSDKIQIFEARARRTHFSESSCPSSLVTKLNPYLLAFLPPTAACPRRRQVLRRRRHPPYRAETRRLVLLHRTLRTDHHQLVDRLAGSKRRT